MYFFQIVLLFLTLLSAKPAASSQVTVCHDAHDPVSLDPHREFDASSDNIVNQIFDGLVALTPEGKIAPALATSWSWVDSTTLEFKLRENVVFHNGEPFTAEAVRFSLKRQLDPKNPAPNAGLIDTIEDVYVTGDLTVKIKTKTPDGVLLNKLPMFVKILPPLYVKKHGDAYFTTHPIGTGPFELAHWIKNKEIKLNANKNYWMKNVPKVQTLIFKFLPQQEQLRLLLDGDVDMVTDLSGLNTLTVSQNSKTKILKARNLYSVSLMFNTRKKPLSELSVRQAIAHTIDSKDLVRYGAKGNAVTLKTLTMPEEFGYNSQIPGYPFNITQAKKLLQKNGYGKGLKLKIVVRQEVANFGKIITAQLEKAGITSEVQLVSQEELFKQVALPNIDKTLPAWDGDIVIHHYVNPTAHVYFPYQIFIYSKGPYSLTEDREFDELFNTMTATADGNAQLDLSRQLEAMIWRKCLAFSTVQLLRIYGMSRRLAYQPNITGMLDFRYLSLERNP